MEDVVIDVFNVLLRELDGYLLLISRKVYFLEHPENTLLVVGQFRSCTISAVFHKLFPVHTAQLH